MFDLPNRHSIRLPGYDYSQQGLYFVTICIQHMGQIMGDIVGVDPRVDPVKNPRVDPDNQTGAHQNLSGAHTGAPLRKMVLNDVGKMMEQWWNKIPEKFPGVELDVYQIMPNHLHGIINICGQIGSSTGRTHGSAPTTGNKHVGVDPCVDPPTLGTIIQWFKTMTTNEYINHVRNDKWVSFPIRLWQRNYYEHIIRNEPEYNKIVYYIQNNPQNAIVGADQCVRPRV